MLTVILLDMLLWMCTVCLGRSNRLNPRENCVSFVLSVWCCTEIEKIKFMIHALICYAIVDVFW